MKRRQKAGFLSPRSSNITLTKEKEIKEKNKKERGEDIKTMVSLAMVHLVITFSKLRLDIVCDNRINYHFTGSYQGSGDGCEASSVFGIVLIFAAVTWI